ncbi:ComEA family DNA-binding protein [Microbacterium betulae]|uniref:ComEA family DNA-binding protein n=1 Tax=Microbacterium betulae TaxID=2981139 RepID=A0AA97FJJ1_9MICO|nr:ComEA family DNA-binding protein [Microbacterium sp. AB]WOF24651.1 ComEA family DNA-binding protein [Microbacterium sp. AB]
MTAETGFRSSRARLGVGGVVLLALGALAVTVGIGVWRGVASPVEDVVTSSSAPGPTEVAVESGELFVHVFGAVREPGLYVLDAGARVVDAISAAGGLADDADQAGVNLARPVADGEQLAVPAVGESPVVEGAGGSGAVPGDASGGVVDVNTADAAALETLPRIGPTLAGRIVAWREENGPFTTVDDLLAVSGIGDKMLETLRPLVTV